MPSDRIDLSADNAKDAQADEFASADLELLADQLRADAEHLATRYPARALAGIDLTPPRRRRLSINVLRVVSRTAAAVLAISCGWWGFTGPYDSPRLADNGLPPQWSAQPGADTPATVPAALFFDLTSPEKEAVLDLFEDRALAQGSLSI